MAQGTMRRTSRVDSGPGAWEKGRARQALFSLTDAIGESQDVLAQYSEIIATGGQHAVDRNVMHNVGSPLRLSVAGAALPPSACSRVRCLLGRVAANRGGADIQSNREWDAARPMPDLGRVLQQAFGACVLSGPGLELCFSLSLRLYVPDFGAGGQRGLYRYQRWFHLHHQRAWERANRSGAGTGLSGLKRAA